MEAISRVMARIDVIRDQVGMPAPGSFQAALDSQLATSTIQPMMQTMASSTSPSLGGSSFAVSRSELDAYLLANGIESRNGRLSNSELQPIGGGWDDRSYALLPPAADAWEAMRAAAASEGVELQVIDGYRSWEVQAAAYDDYLAGRKTANVLPPGTSEHGNGLAVDITNGALVGHDDEEWRWLQNNAGRFGWHPISNETWHWEFRGV